MVKLGDKAKDIITGFEGLVVARTDWLHGCARIGLEPTALDKDGKVQEVHWFDDARIERIACGPS